MDFQLLEINLISAQNLKPVGNHLRRMQSYALSWVDPKTKLRTRIDQIGGQNPTWNDKFIFRVGPTFLSCEFSAVCIEIYAIGLFTDSLIGTVRFFVRGNVTFGNHSFSALQIRRPSGRFRGILNLGAGLFGGNLSPLLTRRPAIGYQDLMGGKSQKKKERRGQSSSKSGESSECSGENPGKVSDEVCPSTALTDWNGVRQLVGGRLCGLGKINLSLWDQNSVSSIPSDE